MATFAILKLTQLVTRRKILLSAVKPTGRPHIGNYFGAMKQFVELQEQYEALIMIADYHALTNVPEPEVLRGDILDLAIDYLAIGLNPAKVVLFKQSDIPEHTELAWIFDCLTTVPYLLRAHAYKDAAAKKQEANAGLLTYPLLMAADILLYDAEVVPVGEDQKQHLEIVRDTAEKFNRLYGELFKLPEPLIIQGVEVVPGLDGRKMSKSYNNTIPLFTEDNEVKRLVMSIVTDSKGVDEPKNPEECNIFALHKLFTSEQLPELKKRYVEGKIGYRESKEILTENIIKFIAPLRERRKEIAGDKTNVLRILKNGAELAHERARLKMMKVKEKIGVNLEVQNE
jgi:tryptophanyl-tRNA synthetase